MFTALNFRVHWRPFAVTQQSRKLGTVEARTLNRRQRRKRSPENVGETVNRKPHQRRLVRTSAFQDSPETRGGERRFPSQSALIGERHFTGNKPSGWARIGSGSEGSRPFASIGVHSRLACLDMGSAVQRFTVGRGVWRSGFGVRSLEWGSENSEFRIGKVASRAFAVLANRQSTPIHPKGAQVPPRTRESK